MKEIKFTKQKHNVDIDKTTFLYFCDLRTGEIKPYPSFVKDNKFEEFSFGVDFEYDETCAMPSMMPAEPILIAEHYTVTYNEEFFVPLIVLYIHSETDIFMVYHRYIYEKEDSEKLDEIIREKLVVAANKFVQTKETGPEGNRMIEGCSYYYNMIVAREREIIKNYLYGKIYDK